MKIISFSIFKGGTGKTTSSVSTAAALAHKGRKVLLVDLEPGDETKLSEVLNPLKAEYDFIIIDTPPGKAMLAFNGLAAADLIVIPASAERMSVDGVADLITHVQKIMWSKFA